MASDYKGERKLFAMKNSKHSAILCLTVLLLVSILAGCASDARPSAWLHGGPDSQGPTLAQYITDECKIDGKQIVKADPLKGWTEGGTTYEQFRAETADGAVYLFTIYGGVVSSSGLDTELAIDGYTYDPAD